MSVDLLSAFVFGLHGLLAAVVALSAFAAGSRGLGYGLVVGILFSAAVILGELTVSQELLALTDAQTTRLRLSAASGAAFGIVLTTLLFEPGTPNSTDAQPDPTTYTNR